MGKAPPKTPMANVVEAGGTATQFVKIGFLNANYVIASGLVTLVYDEQ